MFKFILKILFLAIVLTMIIWLYSINTNISIQLGYYIITTNIFNLILLSIMLLIPLFIVNKVYKKVKHYLTQNLFASAIINNLESLNLEEEKSFLVSLLKYNVSIKDIKYLTNIKEYINKQQYQKALNLVQKNSLPKNIKFILDYYQSIIYYKIDSSKIADEIIKQYIFNKHNFNELFFKLIFNKSFKENDVETLQYLINNINNVKFTSNLSKKKYYCIIQYALCNYYLANNKFDMVNLISNETIKKYPDFSPIYKILCKYLLSENKHNLINKLLIKMWNYNPNFDSLKVYIKYYQENNYENLKEHLEYLEGSSDNKELNLLLRAEFNIKFNKLLEAYSDLSKILDTNKYKLFTQISLLEKERNYDTILDIIKETYIKDTNFWNNYI